MSSEPEQRNENHADTLEKARQDRSRVIIRTSIIGIMTNLMLVLFKASVGILSNSIAVTLDAVNNLSDAVSSIVTILGTKLAGKKPDKDHPLGHGRLEYITALVVASLVIYAGITSLIESIKKIIHPEEADYSIIALIIIAVAVLVKFILGTYVKNKGKAVHSGALEASGKDALFDAILSFSVLVCAGISFFTNLSLEPYVGVIISGFILKAGGEMMGETLGYILGKRADPELTTKIKKTICEVPGVQGAYDLFINNFGPDRNYASVHIELPDYLTVEEVDILTREIERKVYLETGVILTGIGIYSYNTKDDEAAEIRGKITEIVMACEGALQMHGFHVNLEKKIMRFDVVFSFDIKPEEGLNALMKEIKELYPDYEVIITPDLDITD